MARKADRRYNPPTLTRLPKGHRMDVRRDEFNRLIDLLNERGEVVNAILRIKTSNFNASRRSKPKSTS
jgi:hypothetical protein